MDITNIAKAQGERGPDVRDMADYADAIAMYLIGEMTADNVEELADLHRQALKGLDEGLAKLAGHSVTKHLEGTAHDHDQKAHAGGKGKDPTGQFSTERRKQQFETAVQQGYIQRGEGGGMHVAGFPNVEVNDPEEALALFNRFRRRGMMGEKMAQHSWYDTGSDIKSPDPLEGLSGQVGEAVGSIDVMDAIRFGDSDRGVRHRMATDPDKRSPQMRDPEILSDVISAHFGGQELGQREYALLATAYANQINASRRPGGEVDQLLKLSEMAANHSQNETFQARTAWLHDMIGLVGKDRVQGAFSATRGNFSSGGRVDLEDLPNRAALISPARDHGTRIEALTDWLRARRDSQGSLRAKLKIEDPSVGFVVQDGRGGEVTSAYRGNTLGNQFQPFSLRGAFQAKDNHVVRGRDKGAFTNSDMFMSMLFPPKTLTLTSATGTYQVAFSPDFRDSFMDRVNFWRTWRGYTKKVPVEGDSGRSLGILQIMKEDFPGQFNVRTMEGRALFDEQDYTDRRANDRQLQQAVGRLREQVGGGRRLNSEELFQRDPVFARNRQIMDAERRAVEQHLGRSLSGRELEDWQRNVDNMTAVAELQALMQEAALGTRPASSPGQYDRRSSVVETLSGRSSDYGVEGIDSSTQGPSEGDLQAEELGALLTSSFGE